MEPLLTIIFSPFSSMIILSQISTQLLLTKMKMKTSQKLIWKW
uniref:ATP synthase 8 n=1 Tax=Limulus polyphemus TaxID=6850 RepID=O20437_LIMPO|nr:ATP synthase 8 [Limulus polyphemus]